MAVNGLRAGAIARGVGVAVAITVPTGVVSQLLPTRSAWAYVTFVVILVGLAVGGYVAGRAGPAMAMTHGAIAGLVTYLAVQGVGVITRLARGEMVTWSSIPFLAMIATGCGVLGGYLADNAERRRTAEGTEEIRTTEEGDA
ncbi:MAG: hypothetical protein U0Q07_08375 [Acidimicrobiales bacterium]